MYKKEEKRGKKKNWEKKKKLKIENHNYSIRLNIIYYTYNEWHDKFSIMNKQ